MAVLLAVLLDLRVALRPEPTLAEQAAVQRAKDRLLELKKPGDLLVHSPLLSGHELAALGRLSIGPALPVPELRARRRSLVLDVEEQPMYGFAAASATERFESAGRTLVLRVIEPTGTDSGALFDLLTDLDRVKMRVQRSSRKTNCTAPRSEGGRACPGEPEWLYIAPRTLTIASKSETCVWAHPTTGGSIIFEIPALSSPPPGKTLTLTVRGALTDEAANTPGGARVTTEIAQAKSLGTLHVDNRVGWFEKTVPLAPDVPTRLTITAPRDGRRHHCLTAEVEER